MKLVLDCKRNQVVLDGLLDCRMSHVPVDGRHTARSVKLSAS